MKERGLKCHLVILGGTAFALGGYIDRLTNDIDSITKIPDDIKKAVKDFAQIHDLDTGWLNDRVTNSLTDSLPNGWENRTETIFKGSNLFLDSLSRRDLLITKLFALVDRSVAADLDDIRYLKTSMCEFDDAAGFVLRLEEKDGRKKSKKILESVRKTLFR